jgi:hypothetical protein
MALLKAAPFRKPVGIKCNNFALGIVRVQYRSFIGTGAQRSPEKPAPWGTPKSLAAFSTNYNLKRS